jgi:hypothetical protein
MFVKELGRFDPVKGAWRERPAVDMRFFVDSRCKSRECQQFGRFESFIKRGVPNGKAQTIEFDSDEGRALWKQLLAATSDPPAGAKAPPRKLGLPLALFSKNIEEESETYARIERRLVPVGDEVMFQMGSWDPTAEICDNEQDDDGDGQVDCRDDQCTEQLVCRPEKARELRAFIMSECPFGVQVVDAMREVLDNFGRDRSKIDFRVEFVGQVAENGDLSTMHGESELQENIREACAQHHYAKNYQFLDYVWCRNKNIRSSDWEECATGGIKADVIRRCSEGEEGRRLMTESFNLANSLGFRGSPSWLLNNNIQIKARSPEDIKSEFCERNPTPGCENTLTKQTKQKRGGGGGSCG